jgi:membrane fusion protein (multidrug efflux system)
MQSNIQKRNGMSVADDPIREVPPGIDQNGSAKTNGKSVTEPPPAKNHGKRALLVLAVLVVIGAIVASIFAVYASRYESTDDATIEASVVTISPQVSALVKTVNVNDNKFVHQGDVLVELDPTDYQVALDQAKATRVAMEGKLQQAKSEIDSAKASRDEAQAEVDVAKANAANAAADYKRFVELSSRSPGAVSKQQMDSAVDAEQSNSAQVKVAAAKLAAAEAEIATKTATSIAADGDVQKAIADIHKAEVNLSYCTIRAPESGKITRKNVEPGTYIQTGEQLFAIVPIEVWVVANFKETQLDRMRVGQPVTVKVDAYPDMDLHGKVDSIQSGTGSRFSMLPAENATGNYVKVVQRVPVKILLDGGNTDHDRVLMPGMSVVPEVDIRP